MACTIDHLRVDHRVTVLEDFTDLAGVTLRAGETSVLRGLGLDTRSTEIWIELERAGERRQLRFALRATTGPRNGHMRQYFELGDDVETDSPPAKLPEPPPPPSEPRRSLFPCLRSTIKQLRNDTHLDATRVACGCDSAFHREILPARSELSVWACLLCGAVTCSRSFGDDGRFTGNSWEEIRTVALPDRVHAWIGGWPRVKMDYRAGIRWPMSADFVRYPTLFYPADTRCKDLTRLAELEARLSREQSGQSMAACVRATHRVDAPPPAGLPDALRGYAMLWQALQLRPDSPLSDLLHHAQPRSPGCGIAAEALRQRRDVFDLIVDSLQSADATRRGVGFMIARDLRPPDTRLAPALLEMLAGLSLEPRRDSGDGIVSRDRCELILLLIAELELATPEVVAALRALMRKLARHDAFLVDSLRIVVRELDAALARSSHSAPAGPG